MVDYIPELYERIQLYRLIIARDCMYCVAEAVRIAIRLNVDNNHELFDIFNDFVVANYGRAFVDMDPFGHISDKYEKFKDDEMNSTHKMLLRRRHKHVAHTEYLQNGVVFYPPGVERPDGSVSPKLQFEIRKNYFCHYDYQPILKLVGWQTGNMQIDIERKITKLYGIEGEKIVNVTELITPHDIKLLESKKRDRQ